MAPGILDSNYFGLLTLKRVMHVCRTWDSIISLMPKGGETIWSNKDQSPEEGNKCDHLKKGYVKPLLRSNSHNSSDEKKGFQVKEPVKYGRLFLLAKQPHNYILHFSQCLTNLFDFCHSEGPVWINSLNNGFSSSTGNFMSK